MKCQGNRELGIVVGYSKEYSNLLIYATSSGSFLEKNGSDVSLVGQERNCCVADSLIWRIQDEYASTLDDVLPTTNMSIRDIDVSFKCNDAYFDPTLPLFENRFELIPFKCFYPVTCQEFVL